MHAAGNYHVFDRMAKIELHLHLEGAIPLEALWVLVEKYGGTDEVADVQALSERFAFRDFAHFIATWGWKNRFIRSYEDFELIAGAVARDLAAQNVIYAEAFYSPGDFVRAGLEVQEITRALRRGLDTEPRLQVGLITDLVRDHGPQRGARVLDAVAELAADLGVIGIGIGGSEQNHPPEPYAALYERARARGLRTTAHAGEAAGPESIWGAVRDLRVDRIGHGTRAIEDPALVDHLAEQGIPVELCIGSNVRTGVIRGPDEHPVRTYLDRGVRCSINTDDPKMFHTSLAGEYETLCQHHSLTPADVVALVEQSVETSWLDEGGKADLRARIRASVI